MSSYPAVKEHLDLYYDKLEKRADKGDTPYNLRNCAYMEDFSKQKICWIELTDESKFSYSDDGIYLLNTVFFMVGNHIKYLLSVLNSQLIHWYFVSSIGTSSGVGTNRWLKYTVETIPVAMPTPELEGSIIELIDKVLQYKKETIDTTQIELDIDNLIFDAYGLNEEERNFVLSHS